MTQSQDSKTLVTKQSTSSRHCRPDGSNEMVLGKRDLTHAADAHFEHWFNKLYADPWFQGHVLSSRSVEGEQATNSKRWFWYLNDKSSRLSWSGAVSSLLVPHISHESLERFDHIFPVMIKTILCDSGRVSNSPCSPRHCGEVTCSIKATLCCL